MDVRLKLDALILKVPVMSDMDNLVPGKDEKRRNLWIQQAFFMYLLAHCIVQKT